MSREAKKKPGDMEAARNRHLAKQKLFDKIKLIRNSLEAESVAWVTIRDPFFSQNGRLHRLELIKADDVDEYDRVLVIANGKLAVLNVSCKYGPRGGGSLHVSGDWFSGHLPNKQILARVRREFIRNPVHKESGF